MSDPFDDELEQLDADLVAGIIDVYEHNRLVLDLIDEAKAHAAWLRSDA